MTTKNHIGDRLRKMRAERGITAKQLSQGSKVPEKTIYRIETGEVKDPKLSSILPLAQTLECSMDELTSDPSDWPQLGKLKRLFANAAELSEENLELVINVLQKILLAASFEQHMSKSGMIRLDESTTEDGFFTENPK